LSSTPRKKKIINNSITYTKSDCLDADYQYKLTTNCLMLWSLFLNVPTAELIKESIFSCAYVWRNKPLKEESRESRH